MTKILFNWQGLNIVFVVDIKISLLLWLVGWNGDQTKFALASSYKWCLVLKYIQVFKWKCSFCPGALYPYLGGGCVISPLPVKPGTIGFLAVCQSVCLSVRLSAGLSVRQSTRCPSTRFSELLSVVIWDIELKGENSVTHEIGPINSDFSKNVEQNEKTYFCVLEDSYFLSLVHFYL